MSLVFPLQFLLASVGLVLFKADTDIHLHFKFSVCVLHLSACFCQRIMWRNTKEAAQKRNGTRQTGWQADGAETCLQLCCDLRSACSFSPLHLELHMFRITSMPSRRSAWPGAPHHGNIEATSGCWHTAEVRTWAQLCSSPCCEWRGKWEKIPPQGSLIWLCSGSQGGADVSGRSPVQIQWPDGKMWSGIVNLMLQRAATGAINNSRLRTLDCD